MTGIGVFFRFYRNYFAVRFGALPADQYQMVSWACMQNLKLYKTPTGQALEGNYAQTIFPFRDRSRFFRNIIVKGFLHQLHFFWPFWMIFESRTKGLGAWIENWKCMVLRPDFPVALGGGPFSTEDAERIFTPFTSFSVGQYQFTYDRSDSWNVHEKTWFAEQAAAHDIPSVQTIPLDEVEDDVLYIAKPRQGLQGIGIYSVEGKEAAKTVDDSTHFLQKILKNHKDIRHLIGDTAALSTLRLDTMVIPGQEPRCLLGIFRMGAQGSLVDNAHAGGIMSRVTLDSGTLEPGGTIKMRRSDWPNRYPITAHPQTKVEFGNTFVLPYFQEAKALCKRAHLALAPKVHRMSWDVALTDEGPVLVEAACAFGGGYIITDEESRKYFLDVMRDDIRRSKQAKQAS